MEGAIIMANRIITINRMYGSNGRKLGKALAKELGIHYYDRELIQIASEKEGIPYEELLKVDEKRASQWRYPLEDPIQMAPQYRFYPMNDMLFQSECEIIRSIAEKEDCIIIGRCANTILKENLQQYFYPCTFRIPCPNRCRTLGYFLKKMPPDLLRNWIKNAVATMNILPTGNGWICRGMTFASTAAVFQSSRFFRC